METFREELLHGRLVLYLAIRYRTSPEVSERPFRVHTQSEYFIQNHTPIEPPPRDKSYKLRRPTIILLSRNISMADRSIPVSISTYCCATTRILCDSLLFRISLEERNHETSRYMQSTSLKVRFYWGKTMGLVSCANVSCNMLPKCLCRTLR